MLPPLEPPLEPAVYETNDTTDGGLDKKYDDEDIAAENYYKDIEDERNERKDDSKNAQAKSGNKAKAATDGTDDPQDDDAENVCEPFAKNPDGYYLSVKTELDELFKKYPRDESLKDAFPHSEWIKIDDGENCQLVGVLYEDWKAKYVCYAIEAENPQSPPEELKDICVFVPLAFTDESKGYFVIFQSAATGECIKPESL